MTDQRIVGSNQGESSNEWKGHKTPYQMASTQNREGAETGESPESDWEATSGESVAFKPPANEINIQASMENRSAQFKNPQAKQDQGPGANQYE